MYKKKRYGVFGCYFCFQWQYCNMFQKTHKCVKCGKNLILSKVRIVFESDEISAVIRFVQNLKEKAGLKRGQGEFVSADKLL